MCGGYIGLLDFVEAIHFVQLSILWVFVRIAVVRNEVLDVQGERRMEPYLLVAQAAGR